MANIAPRTPSPSSGLTGAFSASRRAVFWGAVFAWTALNVVLHLAAASSGVASTIGLLGYVAGLLLIYVLCGINVVREWLRRPVLFFGRYATTAGPGMVWIDPLFHRCLNDVAVRDVVNELRIGGVQTHDNVPISFNLIMTTRVDAARVKDFIVEVAGGFEATRQRALASVTEVVGNYELDAILHDRRKFYVEVRQSLQQKVTDWGVLVQAVELKDIQITDEQIQQAIAMKARAGKEADAELVRATMQLQIAGKLVQAAGALTPEAWRLKELEVLVEMTRSAQNNSILIPTSVLRGFESMTAGGATVRPLAPLAPIAPLPPVTATPPPLPPPPPSHS